VDPHQFTLIADLSTLPNRALNESRDKYLSNEEQGPASRSDAEPWEAVELRGFVGLDLATHLGTKPGQLFVPSNNVAKITSIHPSDAWMLVRISEVLEQWMYANPTPNRPTRYEVYAQLDCVWALLSMAYEESAQRYILTSLYRKHATQVDRRFRLGRLQRRGDL
jgi:hypothetical protein